VPLHEHDDELELFIIRLFEIKVPKGVFAEIQRTSPKNFSVNWS